MASRSVLLCAALLVAACGSPVASTDAGLDAGTAPDAGDAGTNRDAGPSSGCTVTDASIECMANLTSVPVNGLMRDVYWRAPLGEAPDGGWPAVFVYQGSFFGPSNTWGTVPRDLAFNGYQQARLQVMLLDHGFVVIAPAAAGVAWQTNMTLSWDLTTDKIVVDGLLASARAGTFGPIDPTRLYATGISSGGYMTSRMALSYPGVFRALAIHSAGWATCGGAFCLLPSSLPADHPPTRFLHGAQDNVAPLSAAEPYIQKLRDQQTEVDLVLDADLGHQWLDVSPERITSWFEAH